MSSPSPANPESNAPFAVQVEAVSKHYHIWNSPSARLQYSLLSQAHRSLRFAVPRETAALRGLARWRDQLGANFQALQDVSFTIRKGESIGLIGRNGSGKSTLLQIIAGTLRPTSGEVEVDGRVAAMLELGSGFNPEFTGRENVYLNASILGLSKKEIDDRIGGIVDFADLGVFIDQPVKTYSSGMVVRLGFAVLTQIDPEILIIDEALSVGDFLFQQKCFDTIRRFKERGCTLLFVSHAMTTVLELCDRAMLLDSGHLAFDGPAKDAVNLYEASALRSRFHTGERALQIVVADVGAPVPAATRNGASPAPESAVTTQPAASRRVLPVSPPGTNGVATRQTATPESFADSGDGDERGLGMETGSVVSDDASLQFVRLYDSHGIERTSIISEEEVTLNIGILCSRALHDPHVGFKIRDRLGRIVFETSSLCMRERIGPVAAHQVLVARFSFALPIQQGEYSVTVGFANGGVGEADYAESLLFLHGVKTFHVYKNRQSIIWSGVVNLFPRAAFTKEDTGRYQMEAMSEEQAAKVEWRLADCPTQTAAGKEFTVGVRLANHSALMLNSYPPHPVSLSYHWKDVQTRQTLVQEGIRSPLATAVAPGADETYEATVLAPEQAGDYLLEMTLIQENVRWFEEVRADLLLGRPIRAVHSNHDN